MPTFTTEFIKHMVEESIPLHRFLGLELLEIRPDYAKVRVPFREEVIGDIRQRRWHGGIIAAIMDSVGGIAGFTRLGSMEDKMATIDMRVDFLRGAVELPIEIEAEVLRCGNRILVTTMRAWQEGNAKPLAEGRAVYSIRRKEEEQAPGTDVDSNGFA